MGAILSEDYFSSNNTIKLAYDLIGKYIVRYSHARFGVTKKNYLMFDNPGYCYMYLCYAIHWLFNIVTGNKEFPAVILIRGINNIYGPG